MKNDKEFDAEKYLNSVVEDYINRQEDCFDEIRDYIMEVEPNKKTAEQIRDEIYQIFKRHGFFIPPPHRLQNDSKS